MGTFVCIPGIVVELGLNLQTFHFKNKSSISYVLFLCHLQSRRNAFEVVEQFILDVLGMSGKGTGICTNFFFLKHS